MIVAAPGMMARDVAAASRLEPPSPTRPFAVMQPREPAPVRVPCGEGALELEPGRFTVIEVRHGTVVRVIVTPQLVPLAPDAATSRAETLRDRLTAVGFVLDEAIPVHSLRAALGAHDRMRASALGAPFGSGSWRAEVWLELLARAGTPLGSRLRFDEDAYLVSLELWDRALTSPVPT